MAAYTTPEGVLAVLRLSATDADAGRIDEAVEVSAACLRLHLQPPAVEDWTADELLVLGHANVIMAVEEYRRPGAAFGILDGAWAEGGPVRAGLDHLAGVLTLVAPLQRRYGLA